MAVGSAGTLVVTLTMNNDPLMKGFTGAARAHGAFRRDLRAGRTDAKGMQRGLLELSRGFEDFSTQVGTQGLSGGLRAAGNNLSQFFAIMNPGLGAIAGVGIALATILIPALTKTKEEAKDTEEAVTSLMTALEKEAKRRQESRDFVGTVRKGGESNLRGERTKLQSELSELQTEIGVLEEEKRVQQLARPGRFVPDWAREETLSDEDLRIDNQRLEKIKSIETELNTKLQRRETLQSRITLLSKEEADARRDANRSLQLEREAIGFQGMLDRQSRADFRREQLTRGHERSLVDPDGGDRWARFQQSFDRSFAVTLQRANRDRARELRDELDPEGADRRSILQDTLKRKAEIDALELPQAQKEELHRLNLANTKKLLAGGTSTDRPSVDFGLSSEQRNALALQAGGSQTVQEKQLQVGEEQLKELREMTEFERQARRSGISNKTQPTPVFTM
jgi:hypothetical protein